MGTQSATLTTPPPLPLVDRGRERENFEIALARAAMGEGSAWVIEGPGGIGKTRLARWVAEEAEGRGFQIAWGYSQKEVISPFFPFQQMFRTLESGPAVPGTGPEPGITIYEETKGDAFWRDVTKLCPSHPTLIISREKPETVRRRFPSLPASTQVLWLRRGEGPDVVSPTELDMLGEKLSSHLSGKGAPLVALSGTEYLVSQSAFLPVLRLVQFLRDSAEAGDGMVLVSVNPITLEKREVALLEGEGTVKREEKSTANRVRAEAEPPATVMMHYLEDLEKMALTRPVLLVLDNIQWADGNSLHAFQFLARNLRASNALLLATWKTDEEARGEMAQALDEVMDHMVREGTVHRQSLPGLSTEDARRVAEDLIGAPVALTSGGDQFRRMIGKMGGNPYFIHATVQMLIEEGRLKRESGEAILTLQGEDEEALPESLKRAVVRRLSTHSESERSLLRAAALMGQEFEVAPVAACLGISSEEAEPQLANMEGKGNFVRRLPGAPSRWEFQETLTREVILSEMPPQDLRTLSAALATWWERNRLEDVDSLARFHHTVGDPTKGPRYMRKAIQRAMSDQLPEKVERYHRWLQEALGQQFTPPEERLREGLAIVADCYVQLGASPSLLRVLERLGEISAGPPLSLERAAWTAVIQMKADPKLARVTLEAIEKDFATAVQAVTPHVGALRLDAATDYALHDGHYDEVLQLGQRLLEMAQRDGSRRLTAVALYRMGWALYSLGRTPEAMGMLSRLRDVIASGEPPAEMIKVANLEGVLHAAVGDLSAAARSFQESVDLARKHGHIFSLISDLLNLSQAQGELGQLERQEARAREAVDLARRFNMNIPMALSDLGRALLTQERFPEALKILSQASAIMEAEGASDQRVTCQIGMAAANLGLGNLPAAMVDLTAAEKHIGAFREEWVRFYGLKARIHAARGELVLARRAIEEGLALIHDKGTKLEESKLLQEMERLK